MISVVLTTADINIPSIEEEKETKKKQKIYSTKADENIIPETGIPTFKLIIPKNNKACTKDKNANTNNFETT